MTTTTTQKNYKAFLYRRDVLLSLMERQISLLSTLGIETWKETLQNLKERVSKDAFRVMVIGEFKVGKSTLINGLLGEEILPASRLPSTAIINEIKWGDLPRAIIHYKQSEDGTQQQPEEISVNKLEEYTVIQHEVSDNYVSPYEKVEIFWPLELCHNGVEIIDTPGLSESAIHEQITLSYLPKVDAIVFVFSSQMILSISELNIIENIKNYGYEDIFFVCNRFDLVRNKEKDSVKNYVRNKLSPHILPGKEGERVFFVSAVDALDGRLEGDEDLVINSGVPDLETKLEKFLTSDIGKIKLTRAVKILKESIQVAQEDIPNTKAMLKTEREKLEKRSPEIKESLNQLQFEREKIEVRISQFFQDLEILIYDKTDVFYQEFSNKIKEWTQEYEFQTEINIINPLKINEFVEENIEELVEYLKGKIEDEFIRWQSEELQPFIASRLEVLKQDLDVRISEFIYRVEELRLQLASREFSILGKNSISKIERLLLSSVSGVPTSGNHGWKEGVLSFGSKSIAAINILKAISMIGIIGIGSSSIIGAITAVVPIIASLAKTTDKLNQIIKEETSKRFSEAILKSRSEQAERLTAEIVRELNKSKSIVDKSLAQEIKSLEDQIALVLDEKSKGETNVMGKLEKLEEVSKKLKVLDGDVDEFITSLLT